MARAIALNAKMRRTGVCGAPRRCWSTAPSPQRMLPPILADLLDGRLRGARRRGDARRSTRASCRRPRTTGRPSISTRSSRSASSTASTAAIAHIDRYGSHHTDAIVTEDAAAAERFLRRGRQRDRAAQRLDPVRRWRRVRHGRRDRHLHRPPARARPGRRRAAHHLQIRRPRQRPDALAADGADCTAARACDRRIGLLGGSFNPAHGGHRHISREALERLGLDEVWWLVSPQNPLKPTDGMAPFAERLAEAPARRAGIRRSGSATSRRGSARATRPTRSRLQRRFPRVRASSG